MPSIGQVQSSKVDDIQGHADDTEVIQDKVQEVREVEGEQDGQATQDHLKSGYRWTANETWMRKLVGDGGEVFTRILTQEQQQGVVKDTEESIGLI